MANALNFKLTEAFTKALGGPRYAFNVVMDAGPIRDMHVVPDTDKSGKVTEGVSRQLFETVT